MEGLRFFNDRCVAEHHVELRKPQQAWVTEGRFNP
jgi:hypothetical protein